MLLYHNKPNPDEITPGQLQCEIDDLTLSNDSEYLSKLFKVYPHEILDYFVHHWIKTPQNYHVWEQLGMDAAVLHCILYVPDQDFETAVFAITHTKMWVGLNSIMADFIDNMDTKDPFREIKQAIWMDITLGSNVKLHEWKKHTKDLENTYVPPSNNPTLSTAMKLKRNDELDISSIRTALCIDNNFGYEVFANSSNGNVPSVANDINEIMTWWWDNDTDHTTILKQMSEESISKLVMDTYRHIPLDTPWLMNVMVTHYSNCAVSGIQPPELDTIETPVLDLPLDIKIAIIQMNKRIHSEFNSPITPMKFVTTDLEEKFKFTAIHNYIYLDADLFYDPDTFLDDTLHVLSIGSHKAVINNPLHELL